MPTYPKLFVNSSTNQASPTTSVEMKERTACALCAGEAALFCEPDAAFLCWACDASVHSANFLVARHVRLLACTSCGSVDARRSVSGPDPTHVQHLCASCDHLAPRSPSRSSCSSSSICCLSTSDSAVAPRAQNLISKQRRPVGERWVEQVLLGWGRRMGLRNPRQCAQVAARVIRACRRVVRFPSLRAMLAAALWFAVKLCEGEAAEPRMAVVLCRLALGRAREAHPRRPVAGRPGR